jgi:hypothetical protein
LPKPWSITFWKVRGMNKVALAATSSDSAAAARCAGSAA